MDFNESSFTSPSLVSLTPFKQHSKLSSRFTEPNKPTVRTRKQLSWLSFQGRLVGAEEATCAKTIDTNMIFSVKEKMGWDLFTPIQRVLVVAVVGAAAMKSEKDKTIFKLKKSVELRNKFSCKRIFEIDSLTVQQKNKLAKCYMVIPNCAPSNSYYMEFSGYICVQMLCLDQILLSMQQKLDNLCDQLNYFKDNPEVVFTAKDVYTGKRDESACRTCKRHSLSSNNALDKTSARGSNGDDMFKYRISPDMAEPEERRMSDLSDWAPSVASSVDIQLDTLTMEHDIISLRKECEEKDITIEKLSTLIQATEVSSSKRITELEDIIRRKNMIINKLRKDILSLEQKTINLTRLRRKSLSDARSIVKQVPLLADNVLYDMDSTTSPSSSDSDSPPKNQTQVQESKSQVVLTQLNERSWKADQKRAQFRSSTSPLKERSLNRTPDSVSALNANHSVATSGENRNKMRPTARFKEVAKPKRWV